MQPNATKAKLLKGELVFGPLLAYPDPSLVELAAEAGMDFVRIDCEHGPMTLETIDNMCRAAEAAGITPMARIPANREEVVLGYMDRGLAGIYFPHISTPEDARAAVRHMKFSPMGERGFSGRGGNVRWTLGIKEPNAHEFANRETMCVCLVEDMEGFGNIEQIAVVEGVDVVFIGPGDLSQSMGYPGQPNHPEVLKAIEDAVRRVRSVGKAVGITMNNPTDPAAGKRFAAIGMQVFNIGAAALFAWAMRDFVARIKA
ncbi:MAG: aldolase/citrate lyase family protein [Chloroflexi bacterium]|nr:aldolase/citrate lyase family protein [Chloroflexota bacterium]